MLVLDLGLLLIQFNFPITLEEANELCGGIDGHPPYYTSCMVVSNPNDPKYSDHDVDSLNSMQEALDYYGHK